MTIESYAIVREELKSNAIFKFVYKHSEEVYSLFLTKDENVLFSGCNGSLLIQHSTQTYKPIGDPLNLNIRQIISMDQNSNLLIVGGFEKWKVIKLEKRIGSGNYYTSPLCKKIQ